MSVLLAVLAAVGYAASDVTVARTVHRTSPATVACWAHVVAAAVLLPLAVLTAPFPAAGAAAVALGGGLVAGWGAIAYYAALARGPASVLAPVAASGLALPVLVGVARGERTVVLAAVGVFALLAGVALLSARSGRGPGCPPRALLLAGAAAVAFGAYFVAVDVGVGGEGGQGGDPLWIAGLVVIGSAVSALPVLVRAGGAGGLRLPAAGRTGLVVVGLCLAVADLALAGAMAGGDVALVAVLASSDPALTVVAARLLLAERISRRQAGGVLLTLAGLAGVAAA